MDEYEQLNPEKRFPKLVVAGFIVLFFLVMFAAMLLESWFLAMLDFLAAGALVAVVHNYGK